MFVGFLAAAFFFFQENKTSTMQKCVCVKKCVAIIGGLVLFIAECDRAAHVKVYCFTFSQLNAIRGFLFRSQNFCFATAAKVICLIILKLISEGFYSFFICVKLNVRRFKPHAVYKLIQNLSLSCAFRTE